MIAQPQDSVPQFIEVENHATEGDVRGELALWCDLLELPTWQWLPDIDVMLSLEFWHDKYHYLYVDTDDMPYHFTFHDVTHLPRTEIQHNEMVAQSGTHQSRGSSHAADIS